MSDERPASPRPWPDPRDPALGLADTQQYQPVPTTLLAPRAGPRPSRYPSPLGPVPGRPAVARAGAPARGTTPGHAPTSLQPASRPDPRKFAGRVKVAVVALSAVGFAALSALVAQHLVGVTNAAQPGGAAAAAAGTGTGASPQASSPYDGFFGAPGSGSQSGNGGNPFAGILSTGNGAAAGGGSGIVGGSNSGPVMNSSSS